MGGPNVSLKMKRTRINKKSDPEGTGRTSSMVSVIPYARVIKSSRNLNILASTLAVDRRRLNRS